MKSAPRTCVVMVLALAAIAEFAAAQQFSTGAIEGTTKDPQDVALPQVTVTVASTQGTQSVVTDANGNFRFPYLTPGTYSLSAKLQGFNTVESQNIDVTLGARVRIEVTLTPGGIETIDVSATAPMVDLTSTTTGATIQSTLVSSIPVGRTFSSIIALAPGVVTSGVGEANPSINGASGLENTYIVDGVNIVDSGYGSAGSFSYWFGSLGTGVNYDYIQEVQVKSGGYEPEFGAALGGFINLVTKSGSNDLRGSAFTYFQSSGLETERARSTRIHATFDPVAFQSTDIGFEVGGPLIKDKAFWFAAFDPTFTTWTRQTSQAVRDAQGIDNRLDLHRNIYNYAGNVKLFLGSKHTLNFSAFGDPSAGPSGPQRDQAIAMPNPDLGASEIEFGGHNVIGRWEGQLRDNWLSEASVAYHTNKFEETPAYDIPSGTDQRPAVPIRYGGIGNMENSESQNIQVRFKLSNFLRAVGDHNLRYGLEFENIGYDHIQQFSGPAGITLPDGSVSTSGFSWSITPDSIFSLNTRIGTLPAGTTAHYTALFISDSWSPTKYLNIMAGVRYEQEELIGTLSTFTWKDNWAPRLHVILDPTRDNKSKLSFAYGRFFGKVPSILAARAMSSEVQFIANYPLSSVDLSDPNNPHITGPTTLPYYVFGNIPTRIDPQSKLTYQDEYILGVEREVLPALTAGITYLHRSLGRTLEDTQLTSLSDILNGASFGEYVITNPRPELGFPTPTRKYDAVTLSAQKRLRDNWQFLGSYTWSQLKGNYEGYFLRDTGQSAPFITSRYDFPYLKDPDVWEHLIEDGLLPNDRTHVFNLYGSYLLGFNLSLGMGLKVQSGIPMTRLGNLYRIYGDYEIPLESRGASGRTPTTTDLGLHADYQLRLGSSGKSVYLILNIFNILNQQNGTDFDRAYEIGGVVDPVPRLNVEPCPGCLNPDFAKPTTFQAPRQIQFAGRMSF